jgi:hypothetical protein
MAALGDLALVRKMLRAHESFDLGTDIDARLLAIQSAITPLLEEACGRTFGDVDAGSPAADTSELHWAGPFDVLLLNRPARSITSVTYGGTVSGSTMTGGTTVLASEFTYWPIDWQTGLIHGLKRVSGVYWDAWDWVPAPVSMTRYKYPVLVTGDFRDNPGDEAIPPEITYAASLLIAETWRRENGRPSGVSGPDGSFNVTDPWKDPAVVKAIERNRVYAQSWAV